MTVATVENNDCYKYMHTLAQKKNKNAKKMDI
jgi:hypothetical protein